MLHRAVQSRLVLDDGAHCTITRVDADRARGADDDAVVVLTISSMGFRLMLLLRFRNDEATSAYFTRGGTAGSLNDALLETGNLCCGAINQDFVGHFADLGMSTPYILGGQSQRHVDSLKPDYRADFEVAIGASVQLGVTMCLFTRVPLDFTVSEEVVEASDGELELF
ncbi:hypothetical protein [Cupriavidus oxalaticus]|uniref:hypothetical protein n=1 Tax=Cupriavidus oxalaticus TaxID=96344 RepID=UPI003180448E